MQPEKLLEDPGESSETVARRVRKARDRQMRRYHGRPWRDNASIPPGDLTEVVALDDISRGFFTEAVRKLGLSSRAAHGVLRVSRTLADLAERNDVILDDVLEALQHRRYGDRDLFWAKL